MKHKILFVFFIFSIIYVNSQNLVPNPSFEDTLWCPTNQGQINAANNWFSPLGGGGTSELYNICNCSLPQLPGYSPGLVCIPSNGFGYQNARTGFSYSGIILYQGTPEVRENIEIKLIHCLNPTRTYYAEFYVSLSNKSSCGIKNIGAYFSKNILTYAGHHPAIMSLTPHIEYSGSPIIDTMNWVKVSGYFKPDDEGTQYLTIGNFADSGQTLYQKNSSVNYLKAYYYIDDVFVADSASYVNSLKESPIQKEKIKIYPNPASDKLNIDYQGLKQASLKKFEIYNSMGALVKVVYFKQNESCVDVSDLPQGFYIVAVQSKGKIFARQKVMICR